MPREDLAAEIGSVMAGIERGLSDRMAALEETTSRGFASSEYSKDGFESRVAALESRIAEPREPGPLLVPDDLAPMVARALALLAEAPPLAVRDAVPPAPVVNVTVPLPPQPPPRTERSRVTHDAQGRVVAIERDVA